jgi:HSP20 family molecular chaperone IbpA
MRSAFNLSINDFFSPLYEDVKQGENEISFSVDVPGADKNSIRVFEENNLLCLEAKRLDKEYTYKQAWRINNSYDIGTTKASFKNGVLNISIQKSGKSQRKIPIDG